MHCYICDRDMPTFTFNRDHGDIDPCGVCKEIINDVFTDPVPDDQVRLEEVEPTADEMLQDAEDLASGRIDVV